MGREELCNYTSTPPYRRRCAALEEEAALEDASAQARMLPLNLHSPDGSHPWVPRCACSLRWAMSSLPPVRPYWRLDRELAATLLYNSTDACTAVAQPLARLSMPRPRPRPEKRDDPLATKVVCSDEGGTAPCLCTAYS